MASDQDHGHFASAPNDAAQNNGDRDRVKTTVTLAILGAFLLLAKTYAIDARPVPQKAEQDAPKTVRIVDPDFCKNQTWPYIDSRCLKRADTTAANENNAPARPAPAAVNTPASAPVQSNAQSASAAPTNPPAAAAVQAPARQSIATAPQPAPSAADADRADAQPAPTYQGPVQDVAAAPYPSDMPRHHGHYRYHRPLFFGFRF
jgi:hypothetical protein